MDRDVHFRPGSLVKETSHRKNAGLGITFGGVGGLSVRNKY